MRFELELELEDKIDKDLQFSDDVKRCDRKHKT